VRDSIIDGMLNRIYRWLSMTHSDSLEMSRGRSMEMSRGRSIASMPLPPDTIFEDRGVIGEISLWRTKPDVIPRGNQGPGAWRCKG